MDKRTAEFMTRLRQRVEAADAAQLKRWQQAQKRSKRQRELIAPVAWFVSQPVPTERPKRWLPRRTSANWSSLSRSNPRQRPAA